MRNFTYYSSCNHEQIAIWTYTVITEVQRFDLKHCDSIYDLIWKFCDSIWIVRSRQIVYLLTDSKRIRWLCSSYVCNAALHWFPLTEKFECDLTTMNECIQHQWVDTLMRYRAHYSAVQDMIWSFPSEDLRLKEKWVFEIWLNNLNLFSWKAWDLSARLIWNLPITIKHHIDYKQIYTYKQLNQNTITM